MTPANMQLLPSYKAKLNPKFLTWYSKFFVNVLYRIYCHWTAAGCGVNFSDYTECLFWDGRQAGDKINFADTQAPSYATSDRNSNSCALAIDGFQDATTENIGSVVCHPEQLRALVNRVVYHCLKQRMPVAGVEGHGEAAADLDGWHDPQGAYGPTGAVWGGKEQSTSPWERWDLCCWINPSTMHLVAPLAMSPAQATAAGYIKLMDWVRGEAILQIQTATIKQWNVA